MVYCSHVWVGAPSCFLEMLDKLQNVYIYDCWSSTCCVSWTLGSSPIWSQLKSFYYRYYFGKCSSELAQLIPLIYSRGKSTRYSDRLCVFSVIITRCYEDSILTVSFLAQLDSGILCPYNAFLLPIISLALSLELSDTFFCRFCLNRFPVCFNPFVLLFLVTPCLIVVAVQPCMDWIPIFIFFIVIIGELVT